MADQISSSARWITEYAVLLYTHDPRSRQRKHSHYCGSFMDEANAVAYLKRLTKEDPELARPGSRVVDMTSELNPQKTYGSVEQFLEDKESLDVIYSGGQYVGIGYHYKEESTGRERMLWIQESRGIAY